ncbi:MAG: hypothetical protein HDR00_09845 [Lachnospiraceae bacterium]|nr:hypothetical protein [Lachnospiraceae bacterium]
MNRFKGTKGTIILIVLVCLVIGYYFYLSNGRKPETTEIEDVELMTMTQSALMRNLESNYPPSPREVVKYFSEITQCYYNEAHDEEELKALGLKMREIYDDELIANQTEEEYLDLLKKDVDEYRSNNRTVASYTPSSTVDVEYFSQDGYECARLYCIYDIKQDSFLYKTTLCFILRKDENSHYKIYGWEKVDNN